MAKYSKVTVGRYMTVILPTFTLASTLYRQYKRERKGAREREKNHMMGRGSLGSLGTGFSGPH